VTIKAAVLTVSDRGARGERIDRSGPALSEWLKSRGVVVTVTAMVADEIPKIETQLRQWTDDPALQLILTTGGTGVSPRDITPEATRLVIERELPGFAEAMRARSLQVTPMAMISRAVAGICKGKLIVNLPGSPKGALENLEAIWAAVPHAIEKIQGDPRDCAQLLSALEPLHEER
jgi:molybdenum cofactor synthesis domain-containing protein